MMQDIANKIEKGLRITEDEALYLFEQGNLLEIGRLADRRNREKNNDVVFYNVNRHINPTNICTQSCKFCAYAKKPGDDGAYEYTIDQMIEKAQVVVDQGATEVHMVGGLHPRWRFQRYVDMVSALKQNFPNLHIKAFTAVELDWMAKRDRRPVKTILSDLKDAGLGSLPGGGAEIFHQDVRDQICAKSTADRWLEIHRIAHEMGLHSNCTMLYGHVETFAHRVDHMSRLRTLQDQTEGFNAFIPLAFQPQDNEMGIDRYTLGYDDLKTIAIARLFLDNFRHVKAYWIMLGQDIAQIALNFGANDLDGTVTEEKISRAAGGRSGVILSKSDIRRLIKKAGKTPCERDTLYNPIESCKTENLQKSHEMLLYKAEKGVSLSPDEQELLFAEANLFEIESLSHKPQRSFAPLPLFVYADSADCDETPESYARHMLKKVEVVGGNHQVIFAFELKDVFSEWERPSFAFIQHTIAHMRQKAPELEFSIRGLKQLWHISRRVPGGFAAALSQLKELGVRYLGSSTRENENDLTESEYRDTAQAVLRSGFHASFKVALNAALDSEGEVFWDSYMRRLQTILDLDLSTHPRPTLIVDCDHDCPITPVEYLRALAIARYLAGSRLKIESPMQSLPVFLSGAKRHLATENNPAMKYAPLIYQFGAEQIGGIDLENCDANLLTKELSASGVVFDKKSAGQNTAAPGFEKGKTSF